MRSLPNSSEWNLSAFASSSPLLPIYVKTLGSYGIGFLPPWLTLVTMGTANGRKIAAFPKYNMKSFQMLCLLYTEYLGSWRVDICEDCCVNSL